MASLRTLFILVLLSMVITPLFVRGSRLYPQLLSKMAAHTSIQDDVNVDTKFGEMFGKEAAFRAKIGGTEEDSEREVPTGPDPLHHNQINPTSP